MRNIKYSNVSLFIQLEHVPENMEQMVDYLILSCPLMLLTKMRSEDSLSPALCIQEQNSLRGKYKRVIR